MKSAILHSIGLILVFSVVACTNSNVPAVKSAAEVASPLPGPQTEEEGTRPLEGELRGFQPAPIPPGAPRQVSLTLSLPRSEFKAGESVEVTFTLTNNTGLPFRAWYMPPNLFDLSIQESGGKELGRLSDRFPRSMRPVQTLVLQPGKGITRTITWDLNLLGPSGFTPLPGGTYMLIGRLFPSRGEGFPPVRPGEPRLMPVRPLQSEPFYITVR